MSVLPESHNPTSSTERLDEEPFRQIQKTVKRKKFYISNEMSLFWHFIKSLKVRFSHCCLIYKTNKLHIKNMVRYKDNKLILTCAQSSKLYSQKILTVLHFKCQQMLSELKATIK